MKHLPHLARVAVVLTILPGCFLFGGDGSDDDDGVGGAGGEGPEYEVLPSTKAVKLSSGSNHFCALTEEGTVRCWGSNGSGQYLLGVEHEGGQTRAPIEVEGVTDVVEIDGSYRHTCVVMSGGTVKCWGYNDYGQLGDGTHGDGKPAVEVQGITNAVKIAVGGFHTCALLADGAVKCWGDNEWNQLGPDNPSGATLSATPVEVSVPAGATDIFAGWGSTCILVGGEATCWGMMNSTTAASPDGSPFVLPFTGIESLSLSDIVHYALVDGGVKAWGSSVAWLLGAGFDAPDAWGTPVDVTGLGPDSGVTAIGSCAVANGTLKCWGDTHLGNGTLDGSAIPVDVTLPSAAAGVEANPGTSSCVLLENGEVHCWGYNNFGEVGVGYFGGPREDPEEWGGDVPFLTPQKVLSFGG